MRHGKTMRHEKRRKGRRAGLVAVALLASCVTALPVAMSGRHSTRASDPSSNATVRAVKREASSPGANPDDPWRPLTHYTPGKNWMNDPNGLVYHDGEYHLFYQYNPQGSEWGNMSWGHAVSSDLVHWKELDVALRATDRYAVFSGSAVVDSRNTTGFGRNGKPAMVAVWTRHETVGGKQKQSQSLAYSTDRGRTWSLYNGGAPVLDIGAKDFRDPKVFWDEAAGRWTMAVALSEEHKVSFYSSPDLKNWTHQSDFGPAGDASAVWECPDLFPMQTDGDPAKKRWVLTVNASATAQYFVGDWDGKAFTARTHAAYDGKEGKALATFDDGGYGAWTPGGKGTAFGKAPATGNLPGHLGAGYVDSFGAGDWDTGSLTSPEFAIDADRLNLLVAGGRHPYEPSAAKKSNASVNVVVDGKVVASATGTDSGTMAWQSLNLRKWRGKKARVVIEDNSTDNHWGHIMVDQLVLSDTKAWNADEAVPKVDHGRDYYASVTWNDAPSGKRYAVGWMSNWAYAKDVPPKPWRTAMSAVRELSLRTVDGRERLAFEPVKALDSLRAGREFKKGAFKVDGGMTVLDSEVGGRSLDVSFALDPGTAKKSGVVILSGGKRGAGGAQGGKAQGTEIYYDAVDRKLVVDRSHSGEVGFSASFPGQRSASLEPDGDGLVRLRVVVDASSVEVFAADGTLVMTETVYPRGMAAGSAGKSDKVALFAEGGTARVRNFSLWHLGSYR